MRDKGPARYVEERRREGRGESLGGHGLKSRKRFQREREGGRERERERSFIDNQEVTEGR